METIGLFSDQVETLRVRWVVPGDLGTGEAPLVCRGADGCDYVVKDGKTHTAIPHSEWFCSELGERVGIAAPPHKIMDMGNGSTAFGSRWQGGVLSPEGSVPWYDRVKTGEIALSELRLALSRIYAFDQFVHNQDRHAANVLVHPQFKGHAVLAFDYSQAWLCFGFPLDAPPLPEACKTVFVQRALRKKWSYDYIDAGVVKETCELISSVSTSIVEKIIHSHPSDWLLASTKQDIIEWWGSEDMKSRLALIVEGVENGNCL